MLIWKKTKTKATSPILISFHRESLFLHIQKFTNNEIGLKSLVPTAKQKAESKDKNYKWERKSQWGTVDLKL